MLPKAFTKRRHVTLALIVAAMVIGVASAQAVASAPTATGTPVSDNGSWAASDTITPVVSYNFNDDSGTTVTDSSGSGNNGSWVGGPTGSATPTYQPGVDGQAAEIGGNNLIQLPKVAAQTDASGSFSFEFWYFGKSQTGAQSIIANYKGNGSCTNPGFLVWMTSASDSTPSMCWSTTPTGPSVEYNDIGSPTDNAWHYISVVVDRSTQTVTFYMDGQPIVESTPGQLASTSVLNVGPWTLGWAPGDLEDGTLDGLIDDFNYYDQAIPASQVAADYNATCTPAACAPATLLDSGTLTTAKTTVTSGDAASFDYKMPADDVGANNFVDWFPTGADITTTKPTIADAASGTSGTVSSDTTGLIPGTYDVYLAQQGPSPTDNLAIAGPVKVTINVKPAASPPPPPPPALTTSAPSVPQGTPVTIKYSTPASLSNIANWISWYSNGNTPTNTVDFPDEGDNGPINLWAYAETGTTTLPSSSSLPATSGSVTFSTDGLPPGVYHVYYLFDDVLPNGSNAGATEGGGVIGKPVTIRVTPAAQPTLQTSTSIVTQGAPVTFQFATPSDALNANNVVAWYSSSHTPQDSLTSSSLTPDLARFAQTGTTTAPAAGTSPAQNGTVTFSTTGLAPGVYSVDFFQNSSTSINGSTLSDDRPLGAASVRINSVPVPRGTLITRHVKVNAGDLVSFDYTMPATDVNSANQIEWFRAGTDELTPLPGPVPTFVQSAGAGSDTATFDTTGLASGRYDVSLLAPDKAIIAGPVAITVNNTGPQQPSPGQLPQRPNLILNGGAEIGAASLNGAVVTSVPGWTTTGRLTELQYGAAGGYPAFSSPGSADRGQNFLAAAGGGTSTATQTINVSPAAGEIDHGDVRFNLGGWLGGSGSSADAAQVTATFLSANGRPLGTAAIGPVTPAMRDNTTELLPEHDTGMLPEGTSSLRVTTTVSGINGQGFADNLSFTISSDAVQPGKSPSAPALDDAPEPPASGNPNLIVNGGAEIGHGELDGNSVTTVPGWTINGLIGEIRYGASDAEGIGNWPTSTTPGPTDRGLNFFAGGDGGRSTATQIIDVSSGESDINTGKVSYNLNGWFGGAATQTDTAQVTATFLSTDGTTLGSATLGRVTPAMRNNTTELLPENAVGTLPEHTAKVQVALTIVGPNPATKFGHGQGFADNLSFTLSTPKVKAPPPPKPPNSTVPRFDHVFLIMMENQNRNRVIGNTMAAPYENSLLARGADLTQSFALSHPSDENYTALDAGSMYTQDGNTEDAQIPAQQLGDLVSNAGGTWRGYMDQANGPCDATLHDGYEFDYNPFHQFQDMSDNQAACQEHDVPLSQLSQDLKSTATTPTFSWVAPSSCTEGDNEGCGISIGNQWLSQTLPVIFNSPAWKDQRSLLIITYDEDDASIGGPTNGALAQTQRELIPGIVLGSQGTVVAGSSSAVRYTHYSMTRTIENALGLPAMTGNDYFAQPLTGIWAKH